jgi:hypothetical protein
MTGTEALDLTAAITSSLTCITLLYIIRRDRRG